MQENRLWRPSVRPFIVETGAAACIGNPFKVPWHTFSGLWKRAAAGEKEEEEEEENKVLCGAGEERDRESQS